MGIYRLIISMPVLLLGLHLPAIAQTEAQKEPAPYHGPLYALPGGDRPPLEAYNIYVDEDGIAFNRLGLRGSGIRIAGPATDVWVAQPDEATSITFVHKLRPEATWSFSVYGKREFVPEVSSQAVRGYAEFLKVRHEDAIEILNENEDFQESIVGPQPLNSRYRVVSYRLTDEETEAVTRVDELIIDSPRFLFLSRISAPVEIFNRIEPDARRVLNEMTFEEGYASSAQSEASGTSDAD